MNKELGDILFKFAVDVIDFLIEINYSIEVSIIK